MTSYPTFVAGNSIRIMYFVKIVFWTSFLAVLYTYVVYPLLLKILSLFNRSASLYFTPTEELPKISILIAAFNEEKVISEKIESILNCNYPANAIEIIVGSDHSTDLTNSIVSKMMTVDPRIQLVNFEIRQGKVSVINKLVKKAKYDILLLTDANVIFDKETLFELVKHFKNPEVSLVDSNMVNTGIKRDGISLQEKSYIKAEVYIKYFEGLLWGTMMGPFGGCYALRKVDYNPVPEHFLVDDFYINMKVLLSSKKCVNELKARVYEDVSNEPGIEFNRKVRIAAGSFQNLFLFLPSLLRFNRVSFCFFSHKVLRWVGPFLILLFYVASILLNNEPFYKMMEWLTTLAILTPVLDFVFRKILRVNILLVRFPAHFITTNAALIAGFFRYLSGIKSSIWQPTKRHQ